MVSCSGSLVQSCCGEGGALQTNVTGLCGEHTQCSGHIGFAPLAGVCAFPVYTAQAPSCSIGRERALRCMRFQFSGIPQKRGLGWACVLCLPCPSGSGSQELDGRTLPGAVRLLPSVVPASVSAHAGRVHPVSLLGSWPLAATLPADVSHPESQEVFG